MAKKDNPYPKNYEKLCQVRKESEWIKVINLKTNQCVYSLLAQNADSIPLNVLRDIITNTLALPATPKAIKALKMDIVNAGN